ncbi:N-acetylmuramoyl-L-alanine amidase [Mammaliicoccus sp. A-M4]|uniref:N-acetylmuramoyl-L-alanine amidase n=1 Tax=Mammaliicoccus sp. A-M4 TaxID=2898664 RepID=UPI001EFBB55F|nr:N-acetylmuramoyl-L-alanine amidase [Mammaliicoccus sp. A-M4]
MAKTQAQINARLRAYRAGNVNSPYRITKRTHYDNNFLPMEKGAIDVDRYAHAQCADLAIDYVLWFTDNKVRMWGNARDLINNNFQGYFKIIPNNPSTVPPVGSLAIYRTGSPTYNQWGHVAIVYGTVNTNTMNVLEQNWNGLANKKPIRRKDNYYGCTHFIVPNVKKATPKKKPTTKAKETAKKVVNKVTPKKKMKILLVAGHGKGYMNNDPGAVGNGTNERDFIRKNIVPNVAKYLRQSGHKVDYYGGSNMSQDLYQDTAYGYNTGDTTKYGMYWVSRQKYDAVIEFHLDAVTGNASGGHVIIGSGLKADSIDNNIQKAVVKHVGQIRGVTARDNLLNVNIAKLMGVNYRLVELGFITSKKDMDYIKKNLQAYTKDIAQAISGGTIAPAPAKKPATKKITWAWKGRFYPNAPKTGIKVRKQPGLNGSVVDKGSWLFTKNDWVDFVSVTKKDGYWWVKFKYPTNPGAGYFYCAVCKITDKQEKIKNEKYFGTIKWK